MKRTLITCLLLTACAEAHQPAQHDAAALCPEPHPDCFTFLDEPDRHIPWLPRTDCTQRPRREYYAMRPIWPTPEGSPCGVDGVCGQWGICEAAP